MSDLYERMISDLKEATLAKQEFERDTLRLLKSACKYAMIDADEFSDEDVITILVRERKTRLESAEQYRLGGREDLAARELKEAGLIAEYLPAQLEEAAVDEAIVAAIDETGAASIQNIGQVMAILSPRLKGKADMKVVSQKVREKLS